MGLKAARRYTTAEKAKAILRCEEVGPSEAAKELGIPRGTVSCWAHLAKREKQHGVEPDRHEPAGVSILERVPQSGVETGKKPRVLARAYTPSEKARALEMVAAKGVMETHRELKISRFTLCDWRRKAKKAAQGVDEVESPVGGSDKDPRVERDDRILAEWRKHPGLGPSQVRNQLRRQGFKVSVHTVRLVMQDNGYVTPKVKRRDAHGFVTLFGIASRNGIMMISHIQQLMKEGKELRTAIFEGSMERLSPILMTALTAGLALVPLILHADAPGNEIQAPMAIVILGGLFSSTTLNLLVVPPLFLLFGDPSSSTPEALDEV